MQAGLHGFMIENFTEAKCKRLWNCIFFPVAYQNICYTTTERQTRNKNIWGEGNK